MPKYIFCTGGVVSSVGKGVTAAALGRVLKAKGLRVAIQKLDPYINVDPGTMSPYQHGEVYVTDDGAETTSLVVEWVRGRPTSVSKVEESVRWVVFAPACIFGRASSPPSRM